MIEAISIFNKKVKIPKEKFKPRVSAYGIIKHDNKILLVKVKSSGKWFLPGGMIEIGESVEDAIHREVFEETGIEVEIEKFVTYTESFFYYDPTNSAFQNYGFFYKCKPKSFNLTEDNQVELDESEKPEWVDISKLTMDDFQPPANKIFNLL